MTKEDRCSILLRTSDGLRSASKQYSASRGIIAAKPIDPSIGEAKQNKAKEKLLASARDLMLAKGYSATSVEEIMFSG